MKKILVFAVCVVIGTQLLAQKIVTNSQLKGVWSVESVKWIYPDTTYHLENPQPGFLQFSENRYSFIWTPSEKPRVPFVKLSEPSDEEIIAGFHSLVLNAGIYEMQDSLIFITAKIAKVPGFAGGKQVFEYAIAEDKLIFKMIDETYPSGDKPAWYGKLKTEFRLRKIDN